MADSPRSRLVRGAIGMGGLGALNKLLTLLIAILLARSLGAVGYGYYAFAMAAVSFIAIPAQLGLPQLITRETAACHARLQWGLMHGLRRSATRIAGIASGIGVVIGVAMIPLLGDRIGALDPATFALAIVLLPVLVAKSVAGSFLRGLRAVMHAAWPDNVLAPMLYGALLLLLVAREQLVPESAVAANIAAAVVALAVSLFLLARFWPREARDAASEYRTRDWVRSLVPFSLLVGINVINQKADILMLGVFASAEQVGIYSVVVQGGMLVAFPLAACNAVLGPNVSRLYATGEHDKLQRLITVATAWMSAIAVGISLVLLVFGRWLLQTVFGDSFASGYAALAILVVGQFFNAAMGSVGLFLSMCGYERDTLRGVSIAALVNVVLNLLLIPQFGMTGAAIATTVSLLIWNSLLGIWLYRRMRLVPGPFGRRFASNPRIPNG